MHANSPRKRRHNFRKIADTRSIGDDCMQVGEMVGALTVLEYVGLKRPSSVSKFDTDHYLCECECGNQLEVSVKSLKYRIVKSCGCSCGSRIT